MRDYANPLLLLVVVILLACRMSGLGNAVSWDASLLALCVTAFVVDAALAVARAMSRRRALMSTVWAMVYLVLGSCVWVVSGGSASEEGELSDLQRLEAACAAGGDPLAVDENGDSLLTVAASVGRLRVVEKVLTCGTPVPAQQLHEAARRAAENGRDRVLERLLVAGVAPDTAVDSTTLLCAAAQNAQKKTVALLLQRGASARLADAEGTTPLIHAVIADSAPVVQQLLQAGADVTATDAAGRDAASYVRSNKVEAALAPATE